MDSPYLVDSHAHLTYNRFDGERDDIVRRATEAGVGRIVTIGTSLETSRAAIALADRFDQVYAAVGIHPCDVPELPNDPEDTGWLTEIAEMAAHPKAVAIGEIGLDHYHPAPKPLSEEIYRERQVRVFEQQLDLAESLNLPVVVHQRNCYEALLPVVEPYHGRVRCVFHCWSHDWAHAAPLVEQGHLISFTGIVTYKTAADVQAAATEAPDGSFMVETDCPFLSPVPHRGKRNEPSYVRHVAEFIAELRETKTDRLAEMTTETADRFFFGG